MTLQFDNFLYWLHDLSWPLAAGAALLENIAVFIGALVLGEGLVRLFGEHRVAEVPEPLSRTEVALAALTVGLNSLVTFAGWLLWRAGFIEVRREGGLAALLDFVFLVLLMDVAMYGLHCFAHWPPLFRLLHRTHHDYENPRPLTLFVMNPAECLSFGALWLLVLCLYHATWVGMTAYLVFNLVWGVVGHIGVEPLPPRCKTWPLLNLVSTSSFHAGHHHEGVSNFGFYTLVWDRLFGTLAPRADEEFVSPRGTRSAKT